jgi:hypothetical protein
MRRNKFSLSNYKLLTCNLGELVPVNLTEVLPGDTVQQATSMLLRCTPLTAPPMHPVQVKIHHWFVPMRLVWDDWEDFITGGEDGADASTFPTITFAGALTAGTLSDYFGLPLGVAGLQVNALPYRAYALIFNEWYRDQKLQTALTIDTTDGADTTTSYILKRCNWEKDYFVGAQDDTQLGTEVTLPLGTDAPVLGIGKENQTYDFSSGSAYETDASSTTTYASYAKNDYTGNVDDRFYFEEDPNNTGYPNIRADLSNATAATINELREAMALQKYAEARQIYGARYTEYLRYLGVKPSDARLQRPEYLGGGKQTVQFSEVLSTDGANTGSLKGHGIAASKSNRYRKFFEEHGYIMSLMYVRPRSLYEQGVSKMWSKTTKEEFFQKELQHIGMDEVLNKEVYAAHTTPTGTFGYRNRYDEYRKGVNHVCGEFHNGEQYDHWHFGRKFSSDPSLNDTFITCTPKVDPFADQTNDHLLVMANNSIQARRLLSKKGNPIGFF